MIRLEVRELHKTFTLHHQNGARIHALQGESFTVNDGECVVLHGPSGSGKSTLLRTLHGNYLCGRGDVWVRHGDTLLNIATASPQTLLDVRRHTVAYVSQFLHVIPRVSTLDIVAAPLIDRGEAPAEAQRRAGELLARLHIAERLWPLAPATFSGGEQQRVNIAHGFIADYPLLLLDEPTASLDADNRAAVIALIHEKKATGVAILGIFHDAEVRDAVADRTHRLRHADTGMQSHA